MRLSGFLLPVRKCDVVNRGLSGYNSRWARIVLPRLISSQSSADDSTAAVTVFFGANDCALEGIVLKRAEYVISCIYLSNNSHFSTLVDKNPQQHVPVSEYLENLKAISRLLTSVGVSPDKVIFITPPPLHEAAWEKECILKGISFL